MLPKKQLSGAQKRKKRKQDDQLAELQRGTLHKFFLQVQVMLMSMKLGRNLIMGSRNMIII